MALVAKLVYKIIQQSIKDVMCDRLSFYLVCGIATIIPMKRQRPSSSSPLLLLLQNSGFYNTDNTDASLLLSHPSTSTSTTTTSRFFWRLRKFHDILPWMRDFLLLQRRGFWSGLDWGCIIVKAVALALLLLAFTACKKGFVSLTMVVSSDATAAISLLWLWVAFMLLHRRAFTTTSGVNDSLIIDD